MQGIRLIFLGDKPFEISLLINITETLSRFVCSLGIFSNLGESTPWLAGWELPNGKKDVGVELLKSIVARFCTHRIICLQPNLQPGRILGVVVVSG